MSKVSVSKAIEFRKRSHAGDTASTGTAEATMMSSTARTIRKVPTPFQAKRIMLISELRELVINGRSPLAIQAEFGISQGQYYRLYQKAFDHDCKLIEQWDSDTFREDLAIYKARQEKVLAFLIDKMEDVNMHDVNMHDVIRLKAGQLASELSAEIFRSYYQGILEVKKEARRDIEKFDSRYPLQTYLIKNNLVCNTLTQYKKVQHQVEKEEEEEEK